MGSSGQHLFNERLGVWLRVAGELSYRIARTRKYLHDAVPSSTSEYHRIVEIRDMVDHALEALQDRLGSTTSVVLPPPHGNEEHGLQVLQDELKLCSRWFYKIHGLLGSLPPLPVAAEAVAILKSAFGQTYTDTQPSVVLGSEFLEFDFVDLMRIEIPDLNQLLLAPTKRSVLHLAFCDRDSPPAWSNLAHELGHALDQQFGVSERISAPYAGNPQIHNMVRRWCAEFWSDLIAAKVLGPAPILALLSTEYAVFPLRPVGLSSDTHPATRVRLATVFEYLKDHNAAGTVLPAQVKAYDVAQRVSLETVPKDSITKWAAAEAAMAPLAQEVRREVENKADLGVVALNVDSLARCAARLRAGLPISAQGATREELRRRIDDYRTRKPETRPDDPAPFFDLVKAFAERPLPYSTVLTACFEQRQAEFEALSAGRVPFAKREDIAAMCDRLMRLDSIIAKSISTGMIHRFVTSYDSEGTV